MEPEAVYAIAAQFEWYRGYWFIMLVSKFFFEASFLFFEKGEIL